MPAHIPVNGLDHKQVQSENKLPLEAAWSEEEDCVPLKQRLKMLRAKVLSESREKILISDRSPVDVVKKDDNLSESLGFHFDQDGGERRSDGASSEAPEVECNDVKDRVLSEKLELKYNDTEISEDFLEDLDNVVLKERQKMLLPRKLVGSIGPSIEQNLSDPSTNLVDMILPNAMESGSFSAIPACAPARTYKHQETALPKSESYKNVKVEPLDEDLQTPNKDVPVSSCLGTQISVKSESVNSAENLEDIIDHMMFADRMRLLASRKFPKTSFFENFEKSEDSRTFMSFDNGDKPTVAESSKPLLMKRPRKRRKTATDSIETALEEDAPGLLQVLIEKGVLADEIKLYGEPEVDDALDIEETFSELEDVISKLFFQRQSFLKLAPIRCGKGEKASYCLSCLISLVEQARYLRVRRWPVEWGWCRDLQSFIFVFERHNRIVLERPEYGYATYFFELVDALPVNWQIKRLVTAMKLTSCSRITLIENRPLMVGDDLTEGEARVLLDYGWVRDSGLGTMLNYRDRVVHDRKNESGDSSEWRSKIGKLLTDAYNGGTIVPNDIPKKVMDYDLEIKLEE